MEEENLFMNHSNELKYVMDRKCKFSLTFLDKHPAMAGVMEMFEDLLSWRYYHGIDIFSIPNISMPP